MGAPVSQQPDLDALNQQRIREGRQRMERAGRLVYRLEAAGDHPTRPSDIIRAAEQGNHS